jgi:hypothetical protein
MENRNPFRQDAAQRPNIDFWDFVRAGAGAMLMGVPGAILGFGLDPRDIGRSKQKPLAYLNEFPDVPPLSLAEQGQHAQTAGVSPETYSLIGEWADPDLRLQWRAALEQATAANQRRAGQYEAWRQMMGPSYQQMADALMSGVGRIY